MRIRDWSSDVCSSDLHAVMVGEPDRMRGPRVQVWIFQQAQAPALGGLWSAATAQPVAAVVGIAAQVFPRQRRAVEVQRVEIGGGGIPVLGAGFGHDATSWVAGTSPRIPRCEIGSESWRGRVCTAGWN